MTTEETLKSMVETLTKVNERQSHQIDELTRQVKDLSAQIAWFQRQMFGRKGEKRIVLEGMPGLFGEEDMPAAEPAAETAGTPEDEIPVGETAEVKPGIQTHDGTS